MKITQDRVSNLTQNPPDTTCRPAGRTNRVPIMQHAVFTLYAFQTKMCSPISHFVYGMKDLDLKLVISSLIGKKLL